MQLLGPSCPPPTFPCGLHDLIITRQLRRTSNYTHKSIAVKLHIVAMSAASQRKWLNLLQEIAVMTAAVRVLI